MFTAAIRRDADAQRPTLGLRTSETEASRAYLQSHGLEATEVTAVVFGSTAAVVDDTHPRGSDNPDGMNSTRCVEIVITLPVGN